MQEKKTQGIGWRTVGKTGISLFPYFAPRNRPVRSSPLTNVANVSA